METGVKPVPSIPFLGVTNDGRVMNLISQKWLSICDNGHGYKQVFVCVKNKRYVRYVHRLVAECYVPNPKHAPEINHKDGDKANNRAENLEWCTSTENKLHALRTGLRPKTTERQRAVARKNGKKSVAYLREGWRRWAQTEDARAQWLKNLGLKARRTNDRQGEGA